MKFRDLLESNESDVIIEIKNAIKDAKDEGNKLLSFWMTHAKKDVGYSWVTAGDPEEKISALKEVLKAKKFEFPIDDKGKEIKDIKFKDIDDIGYEFA